MSFEAFVYSVILMVASAVAIFACRYPSTYIRVGWGLMGLSLCVLLGMMVWNGAIDNMAAAAITATHAQYATEIGAAEEALWIPSSAMTLAWAWWLYLSALQFVVPLLG